MTALTFDPATIVILRDCELPETAHLTFAYPFGSLKCVRREWFETITRGAKNGWVRLVTQTTIKPFNAEYTARIASVGQADADAWAERMVRDDPFSRIWNAAKPETAITSGFFVESELDDKSGRRGVGVMRLCPVSSSPEDFVRIEATLGAHLNHQEQHRIDASRLYSRRVNPRTWAAYDAAATTSGHTRVPA
jgi:hypothetical protein